MSDASPSYTLADLEAATQAVRYGLLGLARLGWFRARVAAGHLGVERGTVRAHADALVERGLARRRELSDTATHTFEWRITRRGVELRARLDALIGAPARESVPEEAAPAALIAIAATATPNELPDYLADLIHRAEPIAGYWVTSQPG